VKSVKKLFDKKQLAISSWQLAGKPKSRAHDPLPTGQLKRENRAEIDRDWSPEKREKRASTARSPLGRIAL
jgi:hypothetical protein